VLSPQDRSRRAYPVFAAPFRSEKIYRWAILLMRREGAINTTQVRQKIVQVGIIMLSKGTHLGLINFQGNIAPPIFGFHVVGYILCAETLIFGWEPVKASHTVKISDIMRTRNIIRINLQIHHTHSGVIAGQAEVNFDDIGGVYVARCKYLFVQNVAYHATEGILQDLLSVLGQSNGICNQLIAVRSQDGFQSLLAQCVRGSGVKEDATMSVVSGLLNGHARAVHHQCEQGESLAQGQFGVKHLSSIVVSSFCRNARGQIQIAHGDDSITKGDKSLAVRFSGGRGWRRYSCSRSVIIAVCIDFFRLCLLRFLPAK
jgi:hypothetical protein